MGALRHFVQSMLYHFNFIKWMLSNLFLIFQAMICSRSKIITIGLTLCAGVLSLGVHKTQAAALGPSHKAFNEIIAHKVKNIHYF